MSQLLEKIKDNLVVSVVSIILTAGIFYVGLSFTNLQESNNELIQKVASIETTIKESADEKRRLDKVISNSTVIEIMREDIKELKEEYEEEIRDLEKRVRELEK